jgi:hypothetical protein
MIAGNDQSGSTATVGAREADAPDTGDDWCGGMQHSGGGVMQVSAA